MVGGEENGASHASAREYGDVVINHQSSTYPTAIQTLTWTLPRLPALLQLPTTKYLHDDIFPIMIAEMSAELKATVYSYNEILN